MACYSVNLPLTAKPKSPANSAGVYLPSTSQLAISGVSISSRETVSYRLRNSRRASPVVVVSSSSYVVNKLDPLKVMISGAPASGKGTQCELITKKYGLVHTAAGDLLREEIASGSENGKRAKEYMEKGQLVPDEIVVRMVKDRLSQPDSQQNGWLLDGYPRSLSQATALQAYGFHPDLFIVLEVPEDILVERVIGRRLDPVTGKIYHLKYSPPESDEIAARLTQRFDDTEAKVKLRLQTHNQNVESVLSMYEDITIKVDGSLPMKDVFVRIDNALTKLLEQKKELPRASTIAT
ncbi:adenylate kinase, chloroplastic isoform X2 [Impatiens glandulifera]|uniref:adenylate kinase, chloroplastic isoform X2 n=1 Tax=Impatiens glandulifera TaxID=253017 RepID=UPI001FB10664|nr:adenylate kinase, chloroplastic isoform X2 [Impatiens glandulifera]